MNDIKIESEQHLLAIGRAAGATEMLEVLKSADPIFGKLPGLAVAIALLEGEAAKLKAALIARNLRLAIKHGVDVETNKLWVMTNGTLRVEPLDLDELAEREA